MLYRNLFVSKEGVWGGNNNNITTTFLRNCNNFCIRYQNNREKSSAGICFDDEYVRAIEKEENGVTGQDWECINCTEILANKTEITLDARSVCKRRLWQYVYFLVCCGFSLLNILYYNIPYRINSTPKFGNVHCASPASSLTFFNLLYFFRKK